MSASALLAAVRANPDDDLPRLVFADWLDENGDTDRAEFIRLQVELPRLIDAGDPRWMVDRQRAEELRREHGGRWTGGLRPLYPNSLPAFARGFVSKVYVRKSNDLPGWPEVIGRGLTDHPIEEITLADTPTEQRHRLLDSLHDWPHATALRRLHFIGGPRVTADEMTRLGTIPHLPRLTELDFGTCTFPADSLAALARTPLASHLLTLEVRGFEPSASVWCDALAGLITGSPVGRLAVYGGNDDGWATRLLGAVAGSRVNDLGIEYSAGGNADLEELIRSPHTGQLRRLDLDNHHATPAGFVRFFGEADVRSLAGFAAGPCWERDMQHAENAWAAVLASAAPLAELDVGFWDLSRADFTPVAAGRLGGARSLDLAYTGGGDATAAALREAGGGAELRSLSLYGAGVTDRGATALLACEFPRLEWLNLGENAIGDSTAAALREKFGDRVSLAAPTPGRE